MIDISCMKLREAWRQGEIVEVYADIGSRDISSDHGLIVLFHERNRDGGVKRLFFVHILKRQLACTTYISTQPDLHWYSVGLWRFKFIYLSQLLTCCDDTDL